MTMDEALNRVRNERPVQATLSKPIPIPAEALPASHHGRSVLPSQIGTADNEVWMNGKYSLTVKGRNFGPVEQKGYLSSILVREGDAWKTRMLTWNVTPEPAATSSPTTTPSNK